MSRLHDYHRSSAAYRVRIALAIKGVGYEAVPHDLSTGGQHEEAYLRINPQGALPALEIDGAVLTQSLAILEYLEERYPEPPLLPADPLGRARVRSLFQIVASDIHPLTTIRVGLHLKDRHGLSAEDVQLWQQHWIAAGFDAFEDLLATSDLTGRFSQGDTPTLADIALVPQSLSALRFGLSLEDWPTINRIVKASFEEQAFRDAHPDRIAAIELAGG